jgi:hypothetical protein
LDLLYDFIGAMIYGFAAWNLIYAGINAITKYKANNIKVLASSFLVGIFLTTLGGILIYPPALLFHNIAIILFFTYDLFKSQNSKKEAPLDV